MKKEKNIFQEKGKIKKPQNQKKEKQKKKAASMNQNDARKELVKNAKEQIFKAIEMPEPSSKKIEKSQDIVPLEKSMGKVLKLKDGRYIGIVEVSPINFSTKSHEGKLSVIQYYFDFLKIAPRKMEIFITTERTNATSFVDSLMKKNENEQDTLVKERREELINHVKVVSNEETLSRHFYIIYEYDATDDDEKKLKKSEDEIYKSMIKTRMRIEAFIGQCGNSIIKHKNEDLFASELLYNRNSFAKIENWLEKIIFRELKKKIKRECEAKRIILGEKADKIIGLMQKNVVTFNEKGIQHHYMTDTDLFKTSIFIPKTKDGETELEIVLMEKSRETMAGYLGLENLPRSATVDADGIKDEKYVLNFLIPDVVKLSRFTRGLEGKEHLGEIHCYEDVVAPLEELYPGIKIVGHSVAEVYDYLLNENSYV